MSKPRLSKAGSSSVQTKAKPEQNEKQKPALSFKRQFLNSSGSRLRQQRALLAPGGDGAGEGDVLGKGPTETGHWQRGWTRAERDGSGRGQAGRPPLPWGRGQGDLPPSDLGVWALLEQPGGESSDPAGIEPGPIPATGEMAPGTAGGAGGPPVMPTAGEPGTTLGSDAWEAGSPRSGTRGTRCQGC